MERLGRFFSALIFLASGCRLTGPETSPLFANKGKGRPELSMEGMAVQSFGPGGLEWEMISPVGEAYTGKNIMKIKDIRIQMYENAQKSSEINADQGFMASGSVFSRALGEFDPAAGGVDFKDGDILFSGHVVVVSTDGQKLTTDWLHYKKKADIIVSRAPVRVEREDSVTTGLGLEATSDLSNLKIFKQKLVIQDKKGAT